MSGETRIAVSPRQNKIIEAFIENSDIEDISYKTGVPPREVLQTLRDPEIIKASMTAKSRQMAVFMMGSGLDRMKRIIEEGSDSQAIQALKAIRDIISGAVFPEVVDVTPKSVSASLDELDD